MNIYAFILTVTSGIEVLIHAFSKAIGYDIASLLNKDNEPIALNFSINYSNNNGTSSY
jgi:hypothetical protein